MSLDHEDLRVCQSGSKVLIKDSIERVGSEVPRNVCLFIIFYKVG